MLNYIELILVYLNQLRFPEGVLFLLVVQIQHLGNLQATSEDMRQQNLVQFFVIVLRS